jgi:hypothetical protein
LHQLIFEVYGELVRFVKGETLAGAVEQGTLDNDIGAVDEALAFG